MLKNREKINELIRARRADPNDTFAKAELRRGQKWREKDIELNRKKARERAKRRYYEDPEAAREYARHQSKTSAYKEQRNRRLKARRNEDPAFLTEQRARTRIRSVFRRRSILRRVKPRNYLVLTIGASLRRT